MSGTIRENIYKSDEYVSQFFLLDLKYLLISFASFASIGFTMIVSPFRSTLIFKSFNLILSFRSLGIFPSTVTLSPLDITIYFLLNNNFKIYITNSISLSHKYKKYFNK